MFGKIKKWRKEGKKLFSKKYQIARVRDINPTIPDNEYELCCFCHKTTQKSVVIAQFYTCPLCHHYYRINPRNRIQITFDKFQEIAQDIESSNPLELAGYDDKLLQAGLKSQENSAVTVGIAQIGEQKFISFILNPEFIMASMGSVVGHKISLAFQYATKYKWPVVAFISSGGARMQEGMLSLMQMVKTTMAFSSFADKGLFYLTILTSPTYGGVSASFAMLGDITIAEPGAMIGFAGPEVIAQTAKIKLPDHFQKAEFLQEKGFIDVIVPRSQLKAQIHQLLQIHTKKSKE